jgi:hypothetical protein
MRKNRTPLNTRNEKGQLDVRKHDNKHARGDYNQFALADKAACAVHNGSENVVPHQTGQFFTNVALEHKEEGSVHLPGLSVDATNTHTHGNNNTAKPNPFQALVLSELSKGEKSRKNLSRGARGGNNERRESARKAFRSLGCFGYNFGRIHTHQAQKGQGRMRPQSASGRNGDIRKREIEPFKMGQRKEDRLERPRGLTRVGKMTTKQVAVVAGDRV